MFLLCWYSSLQLNTQTCKHDRSHIPGVEKWTGQTTHKEEQESLHRANPCYFRGGLFWYEVLGIVNFEDAK